MMDPEQQEPLEADSYYDGPYLVFTAAYLRRRGTCCGNGCRHCPYDEHGTVVPGKGERQPAKDQHG